MGALPEEWIQCIGNNIKRRREERGLTQEKLSELLYVAPRTVKRHEKGEGLTLEMIPAYAAVLNCSPVELMFVNVEVNDPVFRAFVKIKGFSEEAQARFLSIVEQSIGLMQMNK